MAIVYPGDPPGSATDVFTVPSDPEGTPLSEAGTGTRDLTQSIQDEGLAIEALQSWAALRTHDHSGDGSAVATGTQLAQINTHQSADTDEADASIHHTIGPGQYQAAAGNHVHDYNGNTIINKPYWVCTSSTRPADPEIGMMIWETDTNCVRAWAGFPGNTKQTGTSFSDAFNRTSTIAGFDAIATPASVSGGNSASTSIDLGADATAAVVAVSNWCVTGPSHLGWTTTVTLGGIPMQFLGVQDDFGGATGFTVLYGLILTGANAMTGSQFIDVDMTSGENTANINVVGASYINVAAFGTVVTNTTGLGFAPAVTVPTNPGDLALAVLSAASGALSGAKGGTSRTNNAPGANYGGMMLLDTPGTFSSAAQTLGAGSTNALNNGAIGINLVGISNLGGNYNQVYLTGSVAGGSLGTPSGGSASWLMGQNVSARVMATPTVSGAVSTVSDDQDITFTTGTAMNVGYQGHSATVDIYLRKSADGQTYVRLAVIDTGVVLFYTTAGPSAEVQLSSAAAGTLSTNIPWEIKANGRNFIVYRGGVQVLVYQDYQNVTALGANYRGWSWGLSAVPGLTFQIVPATVTALSVNDLPIYSTEVIWQLLNVGSVPYVRAETHVGQQIAVNSQPAAFFDTIIEDIFGFFGLGSIGVQTTIPQTTGITISESGHYDVNASVPWDPAYYAFDHAMIGFTVNGQDIGRRNWEFVRGNGYAPGFAQTCQLYMHWRFAAGDVLRVVCSHNAPTPAWLFYNPTSPNMQMATVDLKFTGP